jgi:proteasome lid subunit RPN8/RPN11
MKVRLKQSDYDAIVAYARDGLPNEVCGLIAGNVDNEIKTVEKVYFLPNPDKSPEHFSIDPKEQLTAIKNMREHGLTALGNFHSHPSTPSRPSPEDIKLAYDPKASYLILSLAEKVPVLNAFEIKGGELTPQILEIV